MTAIVGHGRKDRGRTGEQSFAFAPVPDKSQRAAAQRCSFGPRNSRQRDELALFLTSAVNTFTDREVGRRQKEDPSIFAPSRSTRRERARPAPADSAIILTANITTASCLWPTKTTTARRRQPVARRPGDVVREFVDACRAESLRPGLYLSPWDRNNPHTATRRATTTCTTSSSPSC